LSIYIYIGTIMTYFTLIYLCRFLVRLTLHNSYLYRMHNRQMTMERRTLLASAAVALSGCVTGGGDTETNPGRNNGGSGTGTEQETEWIIENEAFSGENSFTVELDASGQLVVGVNVESGGPAVVTVSNRENESIATKEIIAPGGALTTTVESGVYRVTVADASGEVSITHR
jgi:hypothetical protein